MDHPVGARDIPRRLFILWARVTFPPQNPNGITCRLPRFELVTLGHFNDNFSSSRREGFWFGI